MIVYMAKNKINGKVYIGQTVKTLKARLREHFNDGRYGSFQHALRKYGLDNFECIVLEICTSLEHMNDREKYWVKFYNSHSRHGYNLTDGGDGIPGCTHSDETRRKISEAVMGEKNHNWGRRHSEESNRKRSQSLKGKMVGRLNPMFGKHFTKSPETRANENLVG